MSLVSVSILGLAGLVGSAVLVGHRSLRGGDSRHSLPLRLALFFFRGLHTMATVVATLSNLAYLFLLMRFAVPAALSSLPARETTPGPDASSGRPTLRRRAHAPAPAEPAAPVAAPVAESVVPVAESIVSVAESVVPVAAPVAADDSAAAVGGAAEAPQEEDGAAEAPQEEDGATEADASSESMGSSPRVPAGSSPRLSGAEGDEEGSGDALSVASSGSTATTVEFVAREGADAEVPEPEEVLSASERPSSV